MLNIYQSIIYWIPLAYRFIYSFFFYWTFRIANQYQWISKGKHTLFMSYPTVKYIHIVVQGIKKMHHWLTYNKIVKLGCKKSQEERI